MDGGPPAGFVIEDGYRRVDPVESFYIRKAVARVGRGEPYADVAEATAVLASTHTSKTGELPPL